MSRKSRQEVSRESRTKVAVTRKWRAKSQLPTTTDNDKHNITMAAQDNDPYPRKTIRIRARRSIRKSHCGSVQVSRKSSIICQQQQQRQQMLLSSNYRIGNRIHMNGEDADGDEDAAAATALSTSNNLMQ